MDPLKLPCGQDLNWKPLL